MNRGCRNANVWLTLRMLFLRTCGGNTCRVNDLPSAKPFASLSSMAIYSRSHINRITEAIIGSAIDVHRHLGPGLFESAYQACVAYELRSRGVRLRTDVTLPLTYKGLEIDSAYEIDLWVEDLVVVELKCVREFAPVHEAQTLTYVKLTGAPIGLLFNFYASLLKDGIKRIINPEHEVINDVDPIQRHNLDRVRKDATRPPQ